MKKNYEKPMVEKIAFMYRDQVVVASNVNISGQCLANWANDQKSTIDSGCFTGFTGDLTGMN